ncbi:MAG: endonuclease/exonuclease/phosphatase family protein, partial [Sulfitobacter sp.]
MVLLFLAGPLRAEQPTLRVATFNTELARKGPGLLLRDILKGDDPQITAVID